MRKGGDANQTCLNPSHSRKTRVAIVGKNRPGELLFLVPDGLASGEYRLKVRAILKGGTEVRHGRLDAVLTVA